MARKLLINRKCLLLLAGGGLALTALLSMVGFALSSPGASAGAPGSPAFHLGIDTNGDASDDCDTSGGPTACTADLGALIRVWVYLDDLGDLSAYAGMNTKVSYPSLTLPQGTTGQSVWPGCVWEFANDSQPAEAGCNVDSTPVSYTGAVVYYDFSCAGDGDVSLIHGPAGGSWGSTHLVDQTQQPAFEGDGTSESLSVTCTPTTPTPTSTPTPTPTPCSGTGCPDFSIGIDAQGGMMDDCNTSGASTTCVVAAGTTFRTNVYLDDLGDAPNFIALAVDVDNTGVTPEDGADSVWPGCVLEAVAPLPDVNTGCAVGPAQPPVTFAGRVATVEFTCTASGTVSLNHDYEGSSGSSTFLIDGVTEQTSWEDSALSETLTVDCVTPLAYPGDSDGDGCPDMKELQPSPMSGGQRNFLNPWDYWNPTHDGLNRIDDPLLVKNQYFIDQGEPGYNPDTDRTLVGPNGWNAGPPDGKQRVDDMLYALFQYYHDCA